MRNKEILPFVTTWIELEDIMLNEISQTKTNTAWYHLYVESNKQTNNNNKKKSPKQSQSKIQQQRVEKWLLGAGVRGN